MIASHLPTFYLHISSYPAKEQHHIAKELFTALQGLQKGTLADYSPWGLGVVLDSCPNICISLDHLKPAKELRDLIGTPVQSSVYFNYAWSKKNDNDQDEKGYNRRENMTRIRLPKVEYDAIALNDNFQRYEKIDQEMVLKTHTFHPRGLNPQFPLY